MYKGFYDLTSAMLTQTRNLDVVGNNMSNTATTGYKTDRYADTTFDEVMRSRIGNKIKDPQPLGTTTSYATALDEVYTDHSQGALQLTGLPLDFAIEGQGYFAVQTQDGRVYTRNGSFMLDDQGFLALPGQGRVLGTNGQPIYLGTDQLAVTSDGMISSSATGAVLGQLGVFAFADPSAQLQKTGDGMFTANAQPQLAAGVTIHHGMVERANVDLVQQMVEMITCQRALQSASQLSQMYDQLMNQTTTELGRV